MNWHSKVSSDVSDCCEQVQRSIHTLLRASAHPVPQEQNHAGKEAHAELHEDSGEEQNVDEESTLQQRQESPLVVIVFVVGAGPRRLEVLDQSWDFRIKATDVGRDRTTEPVRVAQVGNLESTNLGKKPRNDQSNGCGHNQSRWATESRFAQCLQRSWNVSRFGLSKWFDSAYVTGEKSKHGNTDTALEW